MNFPYDTKLLRDPNEWIWDTASICDVTFIKLGMTNTETPKYSSGVVAYNGKNEKPELIGSITANKWNVNGNTKCKLSMNEVSYTTNYHFNLFSIGNWLRQGRDIGGNNE